ncbi:hypothetical protein DFJ73DRAFT_809150 [Zopfochytrium polystomum]|nr:hypothetical protein DFJ73DRAFT_809150 [Zopfochytrium polystomum]
MFGYLKGLLVSVPPSLPVTNSTPTPPPKPSRGSTVHVRVADEDDPWILLSARGDESVDSDDCGVAPGAFVPVVAAAAAAAGSPSQPIPLLDREDLSPADDDSVSVQLINDADDADAVADALIRDKVLLDLSLSVSSAASHQSDQLLSTLVETTNFDDHCATGGAATSAGASSRARLRQRHRRGLAAASSGAGSSVAAPSSSSSSARGTRPNAFSSADISKILATAAALPSPAAPPQTPRPGVAGSSSPSLVHPVIAEMRSREAAALKLRKQDIRQSRAGLPGCRAPLGS